MEIVIWYFIGLYEITRNIIGYKSEGFLGGFCQGFFQWDRWDKVNSIFD